MGERPYIEKEGSSSHPDDPYTVESVRSALSDILKQLAMDEHLEKCVGTSCAGSTNMSPHSN
jgi:hypothetical protein